MYTSDIHKPLLEMIIECSFGNVLDKKSERTEEREDIVSSSSVKKITTTLKQQIDSSSFLLLPGSTLEYSGLQGEIYNTTLLKREKEGGGSSLSVFARII